MSGDFESWNGLDRTKYIRFGEKGGTKWDSCRLIIFQSIKFSDVKIIMASKHNEEFNMNLHSNDFPANLFDYNYYHRRKNSNPYPHWFFDLEKMKTSNTTMTEEEITNFLNNDSNEEDVFEADVLHRGNREFKFGNEWTVSDKQIAAMLLLNSFDIDEYVDRNGVKNADIETKRDQAIKKGAIIEIDPLTNQNIDKVCKIHKEHVDGYARYEEELESQADAVVEMISDLNSQCDEDNFPRSLGYNNYNKICVLLYTAEQCLYFKEIQKMFGCRKLYIRWTTEDVQLLFGIRLPDPLSEKYPVVANTEFYRVISLPVYKFFGLVKTQIKIPDTLIMAVETDGGSRLFTGCRVSTETETLWHCKTANNIPITSSDCIVSIFNEEQTRCQGKAKKQSIYIIF